MVVFTWQLRLMPLMYPYPSVRALEPAASQYCTDVECYRVLVGLAATDGQLQIRLHQLRCCKRNQPRLQR